MGRFIANTILFSFPIFIAAILMEILLTSIPNDYLLKKQYLDKNSDEIETLILGSSHSFYGLNPVYFYSKAFNASYTSQTLNYDYEILMKYQSKMSKLKTVIIPISYFTLFTKLEAGSEAWRLKNYLIYYDLNTSKSLYDYSEVLSSKTDINFKRLGSYYILRKSQITCSKLGWGTTFKSENSEDLIESGKTSSKRHTIDLNSDKIQQLFRENVKIINLILRWCAGRNVKVLFITPPAFETYRQNLNLNQLNKTIETTNLTCEQYNNCEYLNLLNDSHFIASDYFDADHLSEIGAKKLSRLINDKLSNLKRQDVN